MSQSKFVERSLNPVFSAVVSGTSPVQSAPLQITNMGSASFQFKYGATLNATFQILGSLDGVDYFDMNAAITSATGSAGVSGGSVDCGAIKYVLAQISPSSGSATVTIKARAVQNP